MKTQSYNIFWQRIHKSAKNIGFPLRVMFELSYQCNFYCRHCYVPNSYRKYKELKTGEIFSILDQLADINCFYLGFTGGEPFLREDIMEIFWYAKRKGFEIIIYTNGSLIDEKIADELKCLWPNKVDITIPAISKNTFERISGVAGSQNKVFKAIDLLYRRGVNLGFKSCVLKENEGEIEDIQKFVDSLNAFYRLDDTLVSRLDGSKEPYQYVGRLVNTNSHELHTDLYECDDDINGNLPAISKNSQLFKCGVGRSQTAITPSGELKMCVQIDYPKYKILKTSLKECWQRLKKLVDNIRPDENYKCYRCGLKAYCKWCPAKAWLYNRTFTSCESESRRKAETMRNLVHSQRSIVHR